MIPMRLICESCADAFAATLGRAIAAEPAAELRHVVRCPHHQVAALVRTAPGGEVLAWNLWSEPSDASFAATLAFHGGVEAGLRAELEAEAALFKAAGGAGH